MQKPKLNVTKTGEVYASESQTQIACVRWFRLAYPMIADLLFSIPNGAKMGGKKNKNGFPIQAAIMKGEGMTKGIPDLFFACPTGIFHGLFIEMKTPVGVLCPEQRIYLERLYNNGYAVAVCRSLNDFEKVMKAYIGGNFICSKPWQYAVEKK